MRHLLATMRGRLKAVILRRRLERDLDDEVAFHLAMRQADFAASGMSADAASAAARRRFGNVTQFKEQMRDMWIVPTIEHIRQDVRYAGRSLKRSPGFAVVAVLALAMGIGSTTAIFSLVDAVRLHALPYPEPDRLVELWGNVMRAKAERRGASYPDYVDWRTQSRSFVDMAAFDSRMMTLTGRDEPERVNAEFVSAPYFSLLG